MEHKCKCCGRLLPMEEFYHHYTNKYYAETHPNNCEWHCWICKDCLRKKINNLNMDTFLPILKILNIPFIFTEYYKYVEHYGINSYVLGRYISYMNLVGLKDFGWGEPKFADWNTNFLHDITIYINRRYNDLDNFYEQYLAEFN